MSITSTDKTARCEALIDTLAIPDPFDIHRFVAGLAQKRGRRITLIPWQPGANHPSGMLISTTETDYIHYPDTTSPLHSQHTVLHEIGHLLLDHNITYPDRREPAQAPDVDALRTLLPTLSPSLIRRILGRTVYASAQEREAERFASLLLAKVTTAHDEHIRNAASEYDEGLIPLWQHMTAAVPHVQLDDTDQACVTPTPTGEYRLYRRVIEIRDAQYTLRPHVPPEIRDWARATARERGLDPTAADILVEAAELGAALDAHRAGRRRHPEVLEALTPQHLSGPPNLIAEARWLTQIGTALRSNPDVAALRRRAKASTASDNR
ncbi:DUF6545 domain-containing protein [Saccharothrix sp.]|uniref:DUF6545 domain-containing protein n=1 Tax=Saccharothrix sp. TaxID=1873460 RepID=UPI002810E7B2|nr:DUF6545 domain-containing protein [Saccharothrix sp.]